MQPTSPLSGGGGGLPNLPLGRGPLLEYSSLCQKHVHSPLTMTETTGHQLMLAYLNAKKGLLPDGGVSSLPTNSWPSYLYPLNLVNILPSNCGDIMEPRIRQQTDLNPQQHYNGKSVNMDCSMSPVFSAVQSASVAYPGLWLDFQQKCYLMLEKMRRNEQKKSTPEAFMPMGFSNLENAVPALVNSQTAPCPKTSTPSKSTKSFDLNSPPSSLQTDSSTLKVSWNSSCSIGDQLDRENTTPSCRSFSSTSEREQFSQVSIKVEDGGGGGGGGGAQQQPLVPRFRCDRCQRSYSTRTGLQKHCDQHCLGDAATRYYSCQHCAKLYHSMSALKMHIRTHTLPCKCSLCGKAFSRMWLLNGHLRTHTGEKPFSCSVCCRAFADRSNLRAHMQTHSEVKRYRCPGCARTFSRMGLLTKHRGVGGCLHGEGEGEREDDGLSTMTAGSMSTEEPDMDSTVT